MRIAAREADCARALDLIRMLKAAGLRIVDPSEIAGDISTEVKEELVRETDKFCYITRLQHKPVSSLNCEEVVHDRENRCRRWIDDERGSPLAIAADFAQVLAKTLMAAVRTRRA